MTYALEGPVELRGHPVYVVDGWHEKTQWAICEVYASRSKAEERVAVLKKRYPGILAGVLKRKVK